eukprot:scaffold1426_cov263-Pinguiococcus_pyrenoidosus.AAC.1
MAGRRLILAHVALVQHHVRRRIHVLRELCSLCSNPESQRKVAETIDDYSRVLRNALADAREAGLHDVVAVEEAHLHVGLEPDLVQCILVQVLHAGDGEVEVVVVGEAAQAGPKGHKGVFGDYRGGRRPS